MTPYLGHSAIVFGATSGLGAATALLLAERGANVTLVGRRADLGEEVARKCAATGRACHFIQPDIAKDDQVDAAVKSAVTAYGRITMSDQSNIELLPVQRLLAHVLASQPEKFAKAALSFYSAIRAASFWDRSKMRRLLPKHS